MDYKKYNDNELIYMVQENDERSNNILLTKYQPIIFNLSQEYYNKHVGCGYELDDFYQEALTAFYRAIRSYDASKDVKFYTFVVICIKRALSSISRKLYSNKNMRVNFNNIDIDDVEYCIEDTRENPFIRESYNELEDIIKNVIFTIPIDVSSILELKLNGFTYREISVLLDIPVSSIEFKIRKIRNLLRNKVNAYYCK